MAILQRSNTAFLVCSNDLLAKNKLGCAYRRVLSVSLFKGDLDQFCFQPLDLVRCLVTSDCVSVIK